MSPQVLDPVLRPVRAVRYAVSSARAVRPLLRSVRSDQATEVWVGDAHAMCLNGPSTTAPLTRIDDDRFVLYLGPRLMEALARDGFPLWLRTSLLALGVIGRWGSVVLVFCTGEFDVRSHARRDDHQPAETAAEPDLAFVRDYYRRCVEAAQDAHAGRVLLVVPPPPSLGNLPPAELAVMGSPDERVAIFDRLRREMVDAVAASPWGVEAGVVDATAVLSDGRGGLRTELTDDGWHTNAEGARRVRDLVVPRIPTQRVSTD